jgi:lipopolysaccharide export system permease protein
MRILTRYLLKAHIGPFLFALFALSGIMFVQSIARRLQDLAGKGLPISVVLEVMYLSLPHIVALTLPMAVLVAVLYAFAQLAAENEITALKASGVHLGRMMAPLILVGFLFAGFMLWFNDRVLPDTNHRLKNLVVDVNAKSPTLQLSEHTINEIRTQNIRSRYWLRADRIDNPTGRMHDVVIYDMSNPRKARTVYADSGSMSMNPEQTDMMLTLYDGYVHEVDEYQQAELQRVLFREQRVELKGVGTQLRRTQDDYRTDREMSIAMLGGVIDSARAELATLRAEARRIHEEAIGTVLAGPAGEDGGLPPSSGLGEDFERRVYSRPGVMFGNDLLAYQTALEAQRLANNQQTIQERINQFQVEYHKKYAIPFACIIFVLIGAPLAVRFPRGGVGMVIAASFTIFGIYYMSLIGGESLGDRGAIRPFWGPWAPNLLFGAIALWALSRIGKETASSRGGGWDDLWLTVRGGIGSLFGRRSRRRRELPRTEGAGA